VLEGGKNHHVVKGIGRSATFFAGCKQQQIIISGQLNLFMAMSEGQRNILDIIAGLSNRTVTISVLDSAVIQRSGLPVEEVRDYFDQLEGLDYIMIGIKVSGTDFRLINMTKEGLLASSENQPLR
jgi:hypothetical protein